MWSLSVQSYCMLLCWSESYSVHSHFLGLLPITMAKGLLQCLCWSCWPSTESSPLSSSMTSKEWQQYLKTLSWSVWLWSPWSAPWPMLFRRLLLEIPTGWITSLDWIYCITSERLYQTITFIPKFNIIEGEHWWPQEKYHWHWKSALVSSSWIADLQPCL